MPAKSKTRKKAKTKLNTAETLRRWQSIIGIFSKRDIPDPVAWQRDIRQEWSRN